MTDTREPDRAHEPAEQAEPDGPDGPGGDPACWLDRVCDACGRLVERGEVCPACGAPLDR